MIRNLVHDPARLQTQSTPATELDGQVVTDLLDTLKAHSVNGIGMAANMIGVNKRIIVINLGMIPIAMLNPQIVKISGEFKTEEGCLSLKGTRPTTRYKAITVRFMDQNFKPHEQVFAGLVAQAIQHEVDHCNGILI
ncbi:MULTISPECIES: peptide deformylase [Levilactobacillus]|uniref:Peptide deformylase n=1 Tax=Levilactobacillus paucivorans TaxID=616990 RepID=A0A0R2LU62_9LACO|nr:MULTISPECIES: peptide deformylase [Levilactobacillus]KRO04759.1 peptide deformylase [Levilactobacillus paucivorans]